MVSFHVVLTKETRFMCSEREIALMKPTAVVINTARGKVIDEDALARALAENRLRAAAIDAFEEEPPAPDSPLRALGTKVLMSPHAASYNEGGELGPGIAWADPLGADRARRQRARQRLQPRGHPALEGTLRRRQRDRKRHSLSAAARKNLTLRLRLLCAGRNAASQQLVFCRRPRVPMFRSESQGNSPLPSKG